MKTILVSISLVVLASSCRTFVPIDPNTGEPSARMLPKPLPCGCLPPYCSKKCDSKGVIADSK